MKRKIDESDISKTPKKKILTNFRFARKKGIPENLREHTFIHLKGFAGGLRFNEKNQKQMELRSGFLSYMINLLVKRKPSCLCWDGDNWKQDSYTALIPMIAKMFEERTGEVLPLLAFKLENGVKGFQNAWKKIEEVSGTVIPVKGDCSWEELGHRAIEQTKSKHIVCFGGGRTVLKEYKKFGEGKRWTVFAAERVRGGETEECHLKMYQENPPAGMKFKATLKASDIVAM